MITVYHNPRCSKSRAALKHLESANLEFRLVKYLDEVPTIEELNELLSFLKMEPEELIRKNEAIYKESFKGKQLSRQEWIAAMHENPKLIERPIVVNGNKAVVARPTEKIAEVL
jgi:arsenate reductase